MTSSRPCQQSRPLTHRQCFPWSGRCACCRRQQFARWHRNTAWSSECPTKCHSHSIARHRECASSLNRICQVFGLKESKLALLRADFYVEQVVVNLRDQRFQWQAALNARWAAYRCDDVARVYEGGSSTW